MGFTTKYKQLSFALTLGILILILLLFLIHLKRVANHKPPHATPTAAVVVDTSSQRDIPIYIEGLGTVTPISTITVRTQISGQLWKVLFKEGQLVKAGEQIAQIDPRPYEAQLTQYQGQLERDQALLANARIDLKRYQTLWKQDSVSQQILATQVALVQQYEGAVKTDEGLIAATKVNLTYCRIISPIDGRIGLRLVDAGNFVQTTDTTGLAVINTVNPITIIFTIPEDNVINVLSHTDPTKPLTVDAYDRQQNQLLATGSLITMDNQIDQTTGTVKLRAKFTNADNKLFPNQFVNVKLLVNTLAKATVIPTAALQYSSKGDFVYVLNANQTVSTKTVVHGDASGEYTVIQKGLQPDEKVVVDGADKLKNGMKVVASSVKHSLKSSNVS